METDDREPVCVTCGASGEVAQLEHCRMCRRHFCGDCGERLRGVRFCSEACAYSFMYGDEDDRSEYDESIE